MKLATLCSLALVLGCSGREVTGKLLAQRPDGTRVVAVGASGNSSSTIASDGTFSVRLPRDGTFRIRFVATRGGHPAVVGTVMRRSGRRLSLSGEGRGVSLGEVGKQEQRLHSSGDECTGDGEGVETEMDADEPDAGENEADAGEGDDEHDDVCNGDHDDDDEGDGGEHDDGD